MTNPNYTHLLTIVDRSGSMSAIEHDMRGGLDELFKSQAEEDGTCLVDYVQFDTTYELVFEDKPVADARAVLKPRGGTALLDAIGRGVTELGEKLAALSEDERPANVIVVVVTDGHENSSREWTAAKVKELVERQENEWNWTFTFLGANMDAVATAQNYGFNPANSLTYTTNNTGGTVAAASAFVSRTRAGAKGGYSDEDRQNAVKS